MFRWCAYCQHFIGESAPFNEYAITHGVCGDCSKNVLEGKYRLTPEVRLAQKLFQSLSKINARGEFTVSEALIQEAIEAKVPASDLLLGVIQPALYRVGRQWEAGEVTPEFERIFSAWCESIRLRFSERVAINETPTIILTPVFSNFHDLGINFLSNFLSDNGVSCIVIVPSVPDDALIEKCIQLRPAFCGISVSLPAGVGRAVSLAKRIQSETDGRTRALLGGFAFRGELSVESDIPVIVNATDLLTLLRAA